MFWNVAEPLTERMGGRLAGLEGPAWYPGQSRDRWLPPEALSPPPSRVGLTPLVISEPLYSAKPLSWAARWQGLWSVLPFSLCHILLIFSSTNGFPEEKLLLPALLQLGVPVWPHSGSGRGRATSGKGSETEGVCHSLLLPPVCWVAYRCNGQSSSSHTGP